MSTRELDRLKIIQDITERRLSVTQGAELAGLSRRQMTRLVSAYRSDGATGLISRKRGQPSNRTYPPAIKEYALALIGQHYADFGPTLALEKLEERHGLSVSRETLRKWMIEGGFWTTRRDNARRVYQPRNRRDCFGELIQVDGSHHWWFEERGPKCALLVFVDDATSKLVQLYFAPSESAFAYFHAARLYLERYGKPLALYSDEHSVFRTTHASKLDATTGMTQFGRALNELNIDIICANSPQAKGRVERANKTLQDRLVKELRLRNSNTIEPANAFAPAFIESYNAKFGKEPRDTKDLHRPFSEYDNLDGAMCHKEERTLSHSLTLRYDKVLFILEPGDLTLPLARRRVTVCDYPDGRLEIQYNGIPLPYRTFDKLRSVNRAPVVENKRLSAVLEMVAETQSSREVQRRKKAPARTGQNGHMFKIR